MRLPLAAASTVAAAALAAATLAGPAHAAAPDAIVVKDGVTQPVFPIADAITESVFVQTQTDSDGDGKRDRVHLTITRPAARFAVASIVEPSPYWAGILDEPNHGVDVEHLPQSLGAANARQGMAADGQRGIAEIGDTATFYVTRGYAYVEADSIGSGQSDGCPTTGDNHETLGIKAVVDWLGGRARGWTGTGADAKATWANGTTGMMGGSYNGTLPNQVATTGVEGLKTIVPIAAISSWYDYYRANGLVVAPGGYQGEDADVLARAVLTRPNAGVCADLMNQIEAEQDRVTGDYTEFWRARDYVGKANKVKASVFITHGLEDWNVKTQQFAQWWDALGKAGVTRKLWLHPNAHGGSGDAWKQAVHRWFDHELYGVGNGILTEPIASVERANGSVESYPDWPDPAARKQTFHLFPGKLAKAAPRGVTQKFTDNGSVQTVEELAKNPAAANPHRLAYTTEPFTAPVRLSGTPQVTLRVSTDRTAANLTAVLVDYGGSAPRIVTRGWMDVQNRHSAATTQPITPGEFYTFTFGQQPKDYVFAAGHRIGLLVLSTDHDYTLRPRPGTGLAVKLGQSTLELPLV
jgi:X-Pro dipeptidyl-peptidase